MVYNDEDERTLVLEVDTPAAGSTSLTRVIPFTGRVNVPGAEVHLKGQTFKAQPDLTFSGTTTLEVGENLLTFTATTTNGRSAVPVARKVTYDDVEERTLSLTVNEPPNNVTVRTASITVAGTVNVPTASVTVNGQSLTVDTAGNFSGTLTLSPGLNTLNFLATASNNRSATATRQITYDDQDVRTLELVITSPVEGHQTIQPTLTISGTVNVPGTSVSVNGQGLTVGADGNVSGTVTLVPGPTKLTFLATASGGRNVSVMRNVSFDDTLWREPDLQVDEPVEGLVTNQRQIVVKGKVTPASAKLLVAGQTVTAAADGTFQTILSPNEGRQLLVVLATNVSGRSSHATRLLTLDWTSPVLQWAAPTPGEGALISTFPIPVAASISETASVTLNGQALNVAPVPNGEGLSISTSLTPIEGELLLGLAATDRAGNTSHIERRIRVGKSAPVVHVESPTDGWQTKESTATLIGRVDATEVTRPITLTLNGSTVTLGSDLRFSLPITLSEGLNPFVLEATNVFGLKSSTQVTLQRFNTAVQARIDWPPTGLAIAQATIEVRGKVYRAGVTAQVNEIPVDMDPVTHAFRVTVPLQEGTNALNLIARDSLGNQGSDQVQVTRVNADPKVAYRWDLPVVGTVHRTRTVTLSGQADIPGVASILVNGIPMTLSGTGSAGTFQGELSLESKGSQTLTLVATTLNGTTATETRQVVFAPELPRIRMVVPDSGRPGERIPIHVGPEPGTTLTAVDLKWNGSLLTRILPPFAPVEALVPADALTGTQIPVEAIAVSDQGESVTAKSQVTVFMQGALLVEAYDDRRSLPLVSGLATILGGGSQPLDSRGRAVLPTAMAHNWIKVTKEDHAPVWRTAAVRVESSQGAIDARLTPLVEGGAIGAGVFDRAFGGDQLRLVFAAGTLAGTGTLGATPLSTQGLPALLPTGWSPVSAWWIEAKDCTVQGVGGLANLKLPSSTPALAPSARFAWVRWDEVNLLWRVVRTGLDESGLQNLPLPTAGGYALVLGDPGTTAPPEPVTGEPLLAWQGSNWREGLAASGKADPELMPTTQALRGALAAIRFQVGFGTGASLPSGTLVQVDVQESYTLVNEAMVYPDGFTQDGVLTRWVLTVDKGIPVLRGITDGLGLDLPLGMSRTFGDTELVEGRLGAYLYHDGVALSAQGAQLVGSTGGTLSRGGLTVTIPAGALAGPALLRTSVDSGDLGALWPELAGKGTLFASFKVELIGALTAGMTLSLDRLPGVGDTDHPILVQRRTIQGVPLVVAVGEAIKGSGGWSLAVPNGGNPILEGGSFAVILPTTPWGWVTGSAVVPAAVAGALQSALGEKASKLALITSTRSAAEDQASVGVGDVQIQAEYLMAVSGLGGAFAVPALVPLGASPVPVTGSRRDLGVSGSLACAVPSSANVLNLAPRPFRVESATPAELAEVGVGTVIELVFSTPADPITLTHSILFRELVTTEATPREMTDEDALLGLGPKELAAQKAKATATTARPTKVRTASSKGGGLTTPQDPKPIPNMQAAVVSTTLVEVPLRRSLSQDGRTLTLVPESPLAHGSAFQVQTLGVTSLTKEQAPAFIRRFRTRTAPLIGDVHFERLSLSYPDPGLNTNLLVPAGSVPPWSMVEALCEASGSSVSFVMPPAGDFSTTLRAALGARWTVTVQLRDGRVVQGHLSRYVSSDGRTTLGPDGGRIEGPGGLAVTLPSGALDKVVEFQVESLLVPAVVADGVLLEGETLKPALRLSSDQEVTLAATPIIELPMGLLPPGTVPVPNPAHWGNGPLPLFRKQVQLLPDGTTDEAYVLMDTLEVRGKGNEARLTSLGGLRVHDHEAGVAVQNQTWAMLSRPTASAGLFSKEENKVMASKEENKVMAGKVGNFFADIYMMFDFWLNGPAPMPPDFCYNSGTVFRNWNGLGACWGTASATCYGYLPGAEIYRYRGTTGLEQAKQGRLARGRMLATADHMGRYLNVGGPMAQTIPGQTWIALYAVDPRTGETSIDPGRKLPEDLGFPWTPGSHSLVITSTGDNPFDGSLLPPKLKASLVNEAGRQSLSFAVNQKATLLIETEDGTQKVVRGKITGSQLAEFTATPARISVVFTQAGIWTVNVQGWNQKGVTTTLTVSAIVMEAGKLGPSKDGPPLITSRDPEPDATDQDSGSIIKIGFSEPVRGASATSFVLKANGDDISFRALASGSEVQDSQKVQEVWLVPNGKLAMGATVLVKALGTIMDSSGMPLKETMWSFMVRDAEEVGKLAGTDPLNDMVVHKKTMYVLNTVRTVTTGGLSANDAQVQSIQMVNVSDPSKPVLAGAFGCHGSWSPLGTLYISGWANGEPFYSHVLTGLRVAPGIGIGGVTRDLLLVTSRPRLNSEKFSWDSEENVTYRSRHNVLWAFDITGDSASKGENGTPKLLMCTSLGATTDNRAIGFGSAGGVLGVVRAVGGMSLWDGALFASSFTADARTLESQGAAFNGVQVLARRARMDKGYFADPTSLVASNGIAAPTDGGRRSLVKAVVTGDDKGLPLAFAAMGNSAGSLICIDGKVGDPTARATYIGGGPLGLDGRITDISASVNNERATCVEAMRGSWQGVRSQEQGALVLVGTAKAFPSIGGTFWVLKVESSGGALGADGKVGPVQRTLTPLAFADLGLAPDKIVVDPARMLVVVQAGSTGYVYNLQSMPTIPPGKVELPVLTSFKPIGGFTLADGFLYTYEAIEVLPGIDIIKTKGLVIRNLEGAVVTPWNGIPILVNGSQLYAGALYDFLGAMLGNPNPDSTPTIPSKEILGMVQAQSENNGYPTLRHYYPELGQRYITANITMNSTDRYAQLTDERNRWFLDGDAKLFVQGREIPGAVVLEPLELIGNEMVAVAGTSRSRIHDYKLEIENGHMLHYKCVPYRFFIKSEVLAAHDKELRTDKEDKCFVRLEFKLYENETAFAKNHQSDAQKALEFTVKFNSNTTLFDVVRGGTWYFDPAVSGDLIDPKDKTRVYRNPIIQNALDGTSLALAKDPSAKATFDEVVLRRLSLTQDNSLINKTGTVFGVNAANVRVNSTMDIGLDQIQQLLEKGIIALRRRVFLDGPNATHNTEIAPFAERPCFSTLETSTDGKIISATLTGDIPGAFGLRTAHVLNAIQRVEEVYNSDPTDILRGINDPRTWQKDPGLTKSDLDKGVDIRITPFVNQRFRLQHGSLNPDCISAQYYLAYPRLREMKSGDIGIINSLLTRDLALGPSQPIHWEDSKERGVLNAWIQAVSELPEKRNWEPVDNSMAQLLFDGGEMKVHGVTGFEHAVTRSQSLIRENRDTKNGPWKNGQYYNSGVGILQLALHEFWKRPYEREYNGYKPTEPNPHVFQAVRRVKGDDDGLTADLRAFLLDHYRAPRVDVYVNGMLTVTDMAYQATNLIQKRLDLLEGVTPQDPTAMHVPVINSFNETTVRYEGSNSWDSSDVMDIRDLLANQEDTGNPYAPTVRPDTLRLIAVLRAVVSILNDQAFEEEFKEKWVRDKFLNLNPTEAEALALQTLAKLRSTLSIHAHSQGARLVAGARTRVGNVIVDGKINGPGPRTIKVVDQFDYSDYGNGANPALWWSPINFRSMVHHVNRFDSVPHYVGMVPMPWETSLGSSGAIMVNHLLQQVGWRMSPAAGPILTKNSVALLGSQNAVWYDPGPEILSSLSQHKMIVHYSTCGALTTDNHDFVNAYYCNVYRNNGEAIQQSTKVDYNFAFATAPGSFDNFFIGSPVCERGDCGGVNQATPPRNGAQILGGIELTIEGLPLQEMNAEVSLNMVGAEETQYFNRGAYIPKLPPGDYWLKSKPVKHPSTGVEYVPDFPEIKLAIKPGSQTDVLLKFERKVR